MIEITPDKTERDLLIELCVNWNNLEMELQGAPGKKGFFQETRDRLWLLEEHKNKAIGFGIALGVIAGLIGSLMGMFLGRI